MIRMLSPWLETILESHHRTDSISFLAFIYKMGFWFNCGPRFGRLLFNANLISSNLNCWTKGILLDGFISGGKLSFLPLFALSSLPIFLCNRVWKAFLHFAIRLCLSTFSISSFVAFTAFFLFFSLLCLHCIENITICFLLNKHKAQFKLRIL